MTLEHFLAGAGILIGLLRASYQWTQKSPDADDPGVDESRPMTAHFYGKGPDLQAMKHLLASEYPEATCEDHCEDSKPVRTRSLRIRMNHADANRFIRQGLPWRAERSNIPPSHS